MQSIGLVLQATRRMNPFCSNFGCDGGDLTPALAIDGGGQGRAFWKRFRFHNRSELVDGLATIVKGTMSRVLNMSRRGMLMVTGWWARWSWGSGDLRRRICCGS